MFMLVGSVVYCDISDFWIYVLAEQCQIDTEFWKLQN